MSEKEGQGRGDVALKTRETTRRPRLFRVIMHNDDYTTQEFVVMVLVQHFAKPAEEAARLMLMVHHEGQAQVGVYPRDIAESKAGKVMAIAQNHGFPLLLTTEAE